MSIVAVALNAEVDLMAQLATALWLAATAAARVSVLEFDVPTANARPHGAAVAPDGALWVTEQVANKLGRLDPRTGQFQEFPLPTADSAPLGVVADRAGNIWFTSSSRGYIGELDPKTGGVREHLVDHAGGADPHTAVFDRRGLLWFTAQRSNLVGRLNPRTGRVDVRDVPTRRAMPYGIAVTRSGTPWFCESGTNKLGSIDPKTLTISEHALPARARPRRLAIASDGAIWYSDFARGRLGRFDPRTESVREWRSPGGRQSNPYAIAIDAEGVVWYIESGVEPNTLVRFEPETQRFSVTPIFSGGGVVRNMVVTPAGQLYLAESGVNKVAVATPPRGKLPTPQRGDLRR
jgi:virginiamycin B lyase